MLVRIFFCSIFIKWTKFNRKFSPFSYTSFLRTVSSAPNFSQNELLCLIRKTDVLSVLGSLWGPIVCPWLPPPPPWPSLVNSPVLPLLSLTSVIDIASSRWEYNEPPIEPHLIFYNVLDLRIHIEQEKTVVHPIVDFIVRQSVTCIQYKFAQLVSLSEPLEEISYHQETFHFFLFPRKSLSKRFIRQGKWYKMVVI